MKNDIRVSQEAYDLFTEAVHAAVVDQAEYKNALCWLEDKACELRAIYVPTGGDDFDLEWIVIERYMSDPKEREIGRGRTPLWAIQDAIKNLEIKP